MTGATLARMPTGLLTMMLAAAVPVSPELVHSQCSESLPTQAAACRHLGGCKAWQQQVETPLAYAANIFPGLVYAWPEKNVF
jgi:hypothetical protein